MTEVLVGAGDPMRVGGAAWCEPHQRWECTRDSKRSHERCHAIAVKGTDACVDHAGVPAERQKAKGEAAIMLADAMAAAPRSHPGEVLLKAGHAAHVLLDRMLAVTPDQAASVEQLEVLVAAIDRAARLAKAALDADATDRWVRAQESVASRDADRVQALFAAALSRLGRSWDEPEVRAAFVAALDELEAGGGT